MTIVLIVASYLFLMLNFNAPERVSMMPDILLVVEHTGVLILTNWIVKKHFNSISIQRSFYNLFLMGYCMTLLYMFSEWGDSLYKTYSTEWDAFDPIKYFAMATESIRLGGLIEGVEYFPVAQIYYWMMKILGVNPLVPLFFNEVVCCYAVCILAKFINKDTPNDLRHYSWLFLIPELICFNATSSKDVLCMLCATILFVKSCELLKNFSKKDLLIGSFFFVIFILARTSLAMGSICGVALIVLFSKKRSMQTILLSIVVAAMVLVVFSMSSQFGVGADEISNKVNEELLGDVSNAAELSDQSSNSFARLLIPHNSVEFIVFGFIRSACYIVIDPRFIHSPFSTILPVDGYTMLWLTNLTTLVMFIACFYIAKWFFKALKSEDARVKNMFIIAVLYWYFVGAFNPLMIHIRYRVVYDILFFAVAIRAYLYCKRKRTVKIGINENGKK